MTVTRLSEYIVFSAIDRVGCLKGICFRGSALEKGAWVMVRRKQSGLSATRLRFRSVVPPSLTLRSHGSASVLLCLAFFINGWRLESSGRAKPVVVVPARRVVPEAVGHAAVDSTAEPRAAAVDPK